MSPVHDIIQVAHKLLQELGPGAPAQMVARAEAYRREGDEEAAYFWSRVARAMKSIAASP